LTEHADSPADLEFVLDAPEVAFRHLISAGGVFSALVSEVTRAYTHAKQEPIEWIVDIQEGSVRVPLRGRPSNGAVTPSAIPEIAATIVEGLATIDERAERPPYFTDKALVQARALANLASDELPVVVRHRARAVPVSKQLMQHVDRVIGKQRESYGTVEGRLQRLDLHGRRPLFSVYEPLTGHRVDCHFTEDVTLEDLRPAIDRRVGVRGVIKLSAEGVRVSVEAHELRIFPDDAELPGPDDVLGILAGYE
jgi:hypothetical protein